MYKEPIGFYASITWRNHDHMDWMYFSFGEYDEETGLDSYGVNDERVFFYTSPAEIQLLANGQEDWILYPASIEYVYKKEEVNA